jgi:hypothetical protein
MNDKFKNDFGGSFRAILSRRPEESHEKPLVMITGIAAKILRKYLQNMNLQCSRYPRTVGYLITVSMQY